MRYKYSKIRKSYKEHKYLFHVLYSFYITPSMTEKNAPRPRECPEAIREDHKFPEQKREFRSKVGKKIRRGAYRDSVSDFASGITEIEKILTIIYDSLEYHIQH